MSNKGILSSDGSDFMNKIDSSMMQKLMGLEKTMVKNSYPDIPESEIDEFITGNIFGLMEPLFTFIDRNNKK
jgi:hypothetical protein